MRPHKHYKTAVAQMNMIPLIDIALILLIIFMIISPFLVQSQMNVKLPTSTQGQQATTEEVIKIEIEKSGRMTVEGKRTSLANLEKELILRLSKSSGKVIMVQADKEVDIQTVVTIFDTAKKLGAGRLGIGVLKESK
ncbi:MAG TPA: biopolymer transporter ExbD [Elusimicrobiales bacterium]|nr:biopolymer transporter ExbD [Elusimicrobiales bacterium]